MIKIVQIHTVKHLQFGTEKGELVDVIPVNVEEDTNLTEMVAKTWLDGANEKDFIWHYTVEVVDNKLVEAIHQLAIPRA